MSPISHYYGGHGSEVMANMIKEYGQAKGEQVFYALNNKIKNKKKKKKKTVREELMNA